MATLPASKPAVIGFFEWFGDLGAFVGRLVRTALVAPHEGRELLRQIDSIGPKSLPLVLLAGAATGVVLSLQMREALVRFGAKSLLPALIIYESTRRNVVFPVNFTAGQKSGNLRKSIRRRLGLPETGITAALGGKHVKVRR